jgi:hypothetical protein
MVQICSEENNKSLKKALEYPDNIPISVNDLKDFLFNDTIHYKVVVFYSPCCAPCNKEMKTIYRKAIESCDSSVRFYLILEDCGGVKYNASFLTQSGILNQKMYYLRDSSVLFKKANDDRFTNIVNYIFSPDHEIIETNGVPKNFIVSKDNRLKISRYVYNSQIKDTFLNTTAMRLSLLDGFDFNKIDFDIVDNVLIQTEPICEIDKCK